MIKKIDQFLNTITMYRLVLYYLVCLLVIALIFSILGLLPYSPFSLVSSTLFLLLISYSINIVFTRVFRAPANIESVYISALILALIIAPAKSPANLVFLGWAAIWVTASKYIFALGKKHLFNPVAASVFLAALASNQSADWWVGTSVMLPFVLVGGILIVRKIRRSELVYSFLGAAFLAVLGFSILRGQNMLTAGTKLIIDSSVFFFAFVMLTEPLTTPPTRNLQIIYGALVGFLFAPQTRIGNIYFTPESALLVANVFSYLASPKIKLILKLVQKIQLAPDTYDFVFASDRKLNFQPGQYLEWTLGHQSADDRGNRRYFTIASSPTENNIRMGVKFYPDSSSYKTSLMNMELQDEIVASQLAGDFVLPQDKNRKLVLIAGGIGITPFRSMIRYLLDKNEKRDIVVFYTAKSRSELVYQDVLDEAAVKLGIKVIYLVTGQEQLPSDWSGRKGRIDAAIIKKELSDYQDRTFYVSGPHVMVSAIREMLLEMGIMKNHVVTDYFPGF